MSPNCIVPDYCMWPKTKLSLRLPLWPKIACIRIAFIPDVCMCPRIALLYLPEIVLWPKTACARRLHVPDIALCPKIAMPKLHVTKIAFWLRTACARDYIARENCMCLNKFKSSHKYQKMLETYTLSLLIIYICKASCSKGIIFGLHTSYHGLRT